MAENLYLKHIESIPHMVEEIFPALNQEAIRLASEVADWPLTAVYLYGSGDSLAAATGATGAFMELCHLPCFALTSMQASRYAPGYCMPEPKTVLTIGLSNSGRVARGLEATTALANAGYCPILITSNPDSPGGKAAGKVFHAFVPPFDPVPIPGVRGYATAQLSLYLLAVHLAFARNQLTEAARDELLDTLKNTGRLLQASLDENRQKLQAFGELCAREKRVEVLSAGPCRASADFGMAKTLEATGYTALSPELEEFSHMNFFSLEPEHIPTVIVCPESSRCLVRSQELEESMRFQGRPCLIMTDGASFLADEAHTIRVPAAQREMFAPLVFSFLTALLTAYMPLEEGDDYMHGHRGPFHEEDFPTIITSKLVFD